MAVYTSITTFRSQLFVTIGTGSVTYCPDNADIVNFDEGKKRKEKERKGKERKE